MLFGTESIIPILPLMGQMKGRHPKLDGFCYVYLQEEVSHYESEWILEKEKVNIKFQIEYIIYSWVFLYQISKLNERLLIFYYE